MNTFFCAQVCQACEAGKYNSQSAVEACLDCPANSESPIQSSHSSDCKCNAGLTGTDGGVCTECVAGKYKNASGDAACTNCRATQYSAVIGATSDVCQRCPTHSDSPAGSSLCNCNPGYSGPDGGSCAKCPLNMVMYLYTFVYI